MEDVIELKRELVEIKRELKELKNYSYAQIQVLKQILNETRRNR